MEALITTSTSDYIELAVRLCEDADHFGRVKSKLATNRSQAPLFDTGRFVRNLENAFEQMWEIYQSGEPARHIRVKDSGPSADMHSFFQKWPNNGKDG